MSIHYNAFISYKHAPLDTKVAAEVQTQLERFRIPGAIRKASGIRKIDRIFRDKEELNITSDLNETIETALNNSDFLIVICSTHTKESIWVQREIEFFLKTHPIERVMTVVAEGEPVDVVPEILFHREMELMTEDGNMETVMVPMEPLSCDYRMKFSKARREELPRLAAAILGCGYDDLRQRQRRYRQRRMAIAGAAAGIALVSLVGYYAYTAAQIQKNYEQSLINQSEYLASESQKLMDKGDRMTAMLLAIEALPSEGKERPVTASAQLALSNALYAYRPAGSNHRGASAGIKRSYDHGGAIDQFVESPDGTYLAVTHSGNTLTMWHMEREEILFERRFNTSCGNMVFTNENNLVLVTDVEICCFDPETGEKLWSHLYIPNVDSGDSIMSSSFFNTEFALAPAQSLLAMENGDSIYFIDTITGEIQKTYTEDIANYPDSAKGELQFGNLTFTPGGRYLAGTFSSKSKVYADKQPFLYDLETDTFHLGSHALPRVEAVLATDKGTVMMAGSLVADEFSYSIDGYDYFYINQMEVYCFDPVADTVLWGMEFSFSDYYDQAHMFFSEFLREDGTVVPALVCGAANTVVAIDPDTGETLSTLSFEDTILYLEAGAEHAMVLMKNGCIGIGYWGQFVGTTELTVPDLAKATLQQKNLVLPEGSSALLWYSGDVFDEEWTAFEGENRVGFSGFFFESTGCGIIEGYDDVYYHIDPVLRSVTWKLDMDPEGKNYEYIGYDPEPAQYLFYSDREQTVLRLSEEGKVLSEMPLASDAWKVPEPGEDVATLMEALAAYTASNTPVLHQGMLYYMIRGIQEICLVVEKPGGVVTIPLETEGFYVSEDYPSPDGRYILLKDNSGKYHMVDVEAGTAKTPEWMLELDETRIAWSEDGSMLAASDMNRIRIFSEAKETEIHTAGETVIDLEFFDGMLLVVYSDGNLIRYDPADGSYIGQTDISANQGFGQWTTVLWDFSNPERYAVSIDDTFNLIEPETWNVYTTVGNVVAYDLNQGILVVPRTLSTEEVVGQEQYELGWFSLYTPQELVEKAKAALNGTELTPEQRSQYGLN